MPENDLPLPLDDPEEELPLIREDSAASRPSYPKKDGDAENPLNLNDDFLLASDDVTAKNPDLETPIVADDSYRAGSENPPELLGAIDPENSYEDEDDEPDEPEFDGESADFASRLPFAPTIPKLERPADVHTPRWPKLLTRGLVAGALVGGAGYGVYEAVSPSNSQQTPQATTAPNSTTPTQPVMANVPGLPMQLKNGVVLRFAVDSVNPRLVRVESPKDVRGQLYAVPDPETLCAGSSSAILMARENFRCRHRSMLAEP
jgi:hypothetical protein